MNNPEPSLSINDRVTRPTLSNDGRSLRQGTVVAVRSGGWAATVLWDETETHAEVRTDHPVSELSVRSAMNAAAQQIVDDCDHPRCTTDMACCYSCAEKAAAVAGMDFWDVVRGGPRGGPIHSTAPADAAPTRPAP